MTDVRVPPRSTQPAGFPTCEHAETRSEARAGERVLVDLAVRLGAASDRDEVLHATRRALAAALPPAAAWAIVLGRDGPQKRRPPRGSDAPGNDANDQVCVFTDRAHLERIRPELARRLPALGGSAWLTVSLACDADRFGVLGVEWPGPGTPGARIEQDLQTLGVLVSQALQAVAARTRDHALTRHLQESLLPVVGAVEGLDVSYRYRPAGRDALAGGDFYDVVPLERGKTAVVIGDVAGHGVDAAASSGEVRYLVRGVLEHTHDPATVLSSVDSALTRNGRGTAMVTLLCAVLDADAGELRMASAGHLPPILRRSTGQARRAELRPAPPLGAGFLAAGTPPATEKFDFGPGDVAVLYTDGLVERRATPLAQVLESLERLVGGEDDPAALCGSLEEFARTGRDHDDDLALLVVRRQAG